MAFDPSTFSAEQRRIMHRAGRADGDAERAAAWIAFINSQRTGPGVVYVQDHVPDGSDLTGANMCASIQAAIEAAQDAGIEVVQIPAGDYYMNSTDENFIYNSGTSRQKGITICGAGYEKTQLIYPDEYSGTAFTFKGSPPQSTQFLVGGGMRDMTISVATENEANIGVGIHIEGCINTTFDNVVVRNLTGGIGFKSTKGAPDFTNQYVQFYNFTCAGCGYSFDIKSLVNSQGYGVYSGAARIRDFLIDDVKFSIYGGYMQSSCDIGVEFEAGSDGGCRFVLYDIYWEGINADRVQFKMGTPAVTFNTLEVHGFQNGGDPDIFLDVDTANTCVLDNIYQIGQCNTYVKGRNGAVVHMINSGDPANDPTKFDLDTTTLLKLTCTNNGNTYVGTKHRAVGGFALPEYAEGQEPGAAETGDLIRNTLSVRPRFKGASAWSDLAFASDPSDLTSILAPYAVEIFDPAVFRTRTINTGEVETLVGVLNGTSLSAPTSGQRPAFTAADDYFGGKPSFTCALTGDHFLTGTLATTIPIGSHAGLFVVYRVPGGTNDPANRRAVAVIEKASDHTSAVTVGQSDLNQSNKAYAFVSGAASSQFAVGATGTDAYGHAAYGYADSFVHLARDQEAIATGLTPGVTGSVIDKITIGGVFNSLAYVGCDITVAYVAVLSSTLSADDITKALKAALAKYSLR